MSDDYRMDHRPGGPEFGAPLHDLTNDEHGIFPHDAYTHPHYYTADYGSGRADPEMVSQMHAARGKPDHQVTIYRALPKEHSATIRHGDWVTTSAHYARQHAMQDNPDHDWPVVKAKVPAKHVWNNGDDLIEQGYHGPHVDAEIHFSGGKHAALVHMAVDDGKDGHRLSYDHESEYTGGSKYPNEEYIRATHPEHGSVGYVQFLRGNRVNSPIRIKNLQVHEQHRRKGYGSALMDELQRQYPKAAIDHGDRTDDGKAWWGSYGQGKADRRGRTARRLPFAEASKPRASEKPQSCSWCSEPATRSLLWAEGKAYIPSCDRHLLGAYEHVRREYGDKPDAVHTVRKSAAVDESLPTKRLFGRTYGLDHRLFDGDRLRSDVTTYILTTLDQYWRPLVGPDWRSWARVYLAGSEASEWTSIKLEGNNDFDILIGVEYDIARSRVPGFADMSDEEITDELNHGFRADLMPRTQPVWIPVRMGDVEESGAWHPDQLSHQSNASSWPLSTEGARRRQTWPASTESPSRRSAAISMPRESLGSWVDAGPDCIPLAPSAESVNRLRPTPRTAHASLASPSTCATTTSDARTGSPRSGSTSCSPNRAVAAAGAAGATSSSSSTTTTGAARGSGRAGSASVASSAPDTTRPSPTSVSPIWAPQSSGLTAEYLPPLPDGWTWVGPFDNTFYVNHDSWDIRAIRPYAAYDVTNHRWAVKPPHLPDWDIEHFPEGHALVEMGHAYDQLVDAIKSLPEPYRTQQGDALWRHLHSDRSRAFSENGEGWYDPGNVMEKWLDQKGTWKDLWELHHRAEEDPASLRAPADWSNQPI